MLGISRAAFYKLMQDGAFPVVKIGTRTLLRPSDLEKLVERSTVKKTPAPPKRDR